MNAYTYDFEVQTMSTMFMNAFSDIVIKRINVNKEARDSIKTRIVYAPKQRVLLDILDKDQNIQLPVISVSIGGIAKDESRVFNKILGTYNASSNVSSVLEKALPVDITYNVSILTRFQQDMDQILSHILPYVNPYFVVSWRTPSKPDFEIRSNVFWSGNVAVQYPVDVAATQVARVVADLSFTFKGWIFQNSQDVGNIYTFNTSIINTPEIPSEYLLSTGRKELTAGADNFIYNAVPPKPQFIEPASTGINTSQRFNTWGSGYEAITNVYLSGDPVFSASSLYSPFSTNSKLSALYPPFNALKLSSSSWSTDNIGSMSFVLAPTNIAGKLDVIVENSQGYGTLINNVRIDTSNPYPIDSPLHDSFVPYQVPYLNGISIFGINHPYLHGPYWATRQVIGLGSTLYTSQTANIAAANLTDVMIDDHLTSTDQNGTIINFRLSTHPYVIVLESVGYYYDEEPIVSDSTVLYQGRHTFQTSTSAQGVSDINLDGNLDRWSVDANGIISWTMISAHPFYQLGYYTNTLNLSNEISVLYSTVGTAATPVTGISGTVDVDGDSNLDNWETDLDGIISWVMVSAHPYFNLGYYTDAEALSSGISILYRSPGSGATVVSNVTGAPVDIDGDGNLDTWTTNTSGIITWHMISAHPYYYPIFGGYSDYISITAMQGAIIYNGQGSTAAVVGISSAIYDVDGDGNLDTWTTNTSGIVTWVMLSAHPYSNLSYYTDAEVLSSGISILYNSKGTGATVAVNVTGVLIDIDGDTSKDVWITNSSGVISWEPAKFYFWNTDPEQCVWWNATSWWNNLSHTISAEMLPLSTSNVIILGTIPVSANLDRADWVQPRSLNTGTAEVIFYSELYNTVTIDITGNTTFALSSVYAPL